MSPTISSWVPLNEDAYPEAPCVWCSGPTDIRAATPFRPDLGAVPLHLVCGAEIIDLYNRHRLLEPGMQDRMARLMALPQLESGG